MKSALKELDIFVLCIFCWLFYDFYNQELFLVRFLDGFIYENWIDVVIISICLNIELSNKIGCMDLQE